VGSLVNENVAIAVMVHDLRNLLNVIILCAQSIYDKVPPGEADQEFAELQRSIDHATNLMRRLLSPKHETSFSRSPQDLNQIISRASQILAWIVGHAIQVTFRLWPTPLTTMADAVEVERLLLNLAMNAREAMPDGGLLTIETERVDVDVHAGSEIASLARLRVSDTGRGMTKEVKAHIFEPFFSTERSGAGLGLNSVAFTVEQLGGTLSVESQTGAGTSVTVQLPLADPNIPVSPTLAET
jgi:two-component system, cell cycle sensor histidine kinase and response regulator CckA